MSTLNIHNDNKRIILICIKFYMQMSRTFLHSVSFYLCIDAIEIGFQNVLQGPIIDLWTHALFTFTNGIKL